MKKTRIFKISTTFCLLLQTFAAIAEERSKELSCFDGDTSKKEAVYINKSQGLAKRVDEHTLEVSYLKGKYRFKDIPPYDEPLDGISWRYCGYSADVKLHLIEKHDNETFTGVLFNDLTGFIINAGYKVSFSQNSQFYFAALQENGMDGEMWSLYNIAGNELWSSYAGISERINDITYAYAELSNPRWINSELTAQAACKSDNTKTAQVSLKYDHGSYVWWPKLNCPPYP